MKISGIYKIQSIVRPQRYYIGSSLNIHRRWREHYRQLKKGIHHSVKLQNHFNKYGESDLQFSILLGCEEEVLLSNEQYFLDANITYFNNCKIAGNTLGLKLSEESKQKMRKPKAEETKLKMRKPKSEETRKKMSESKRGKKRIPFTEDHCKNMSNGKKGNIPWNKGKHPSNETRELQRKSHIGQSPWNKGLKRKKESDEFLQTSLN